jgi:hypothetical protein
MSSFACLLFFRQFNGVDSNCSVWYSSPFLLVIVSDSEEEKCEICISDTMLFKVFCATKDHVTVLASVHSITTMDIHLMFDNFDVKDTLNDFFCVQCVSDELGQVAPRIHLMNWLYLFHCLLAIQL